MPPVITHDPRYHLVRLKRVLQGVTFPLVILSCVIGASAIGAEWPSRTITTILTWESRRFRVLTAKLVAAVLAAMTLTLLALVVLGLTLLPSALLHGTTAGTDHGWWRSVAGVVIRATAMGGIGAAIGFSFASVGRNTGVAMGVMFAYFALIERLIIGFVHGLERWLFIGNAVSFVSGKPFEFGNVHSRSVTVSGLYLAAVAVGCYAVAATVFRRRDVT